MFVFPATATLSSYILLPKTPLPYFENLTPKLLHLRQILTKSANTTSLVCKSEHRTERGLEFDVGDTFFRHESATGRDLGVLAAALYKKSRGCLRILDAMCGCGIRALRYLVEAEADFVLANDANDNYRRTILGNLSRVERGFGGERKWAITHFNANKVLLESYLQKDYYDLIDIDSFGSDSNFLRSAICAVKFDGLLYITSTDGYSSGGHRPHHCLAAYGAYIRHMPYANEVGLRMLIGGAVREASVLGYHVTPLFSYYSFHGPVFRVMLHVARGKLPSSRHYGFISYCTECGNSHEFSWDELGRMKCVCGTNVPGSLFVSGPVWTGPLHSATYLTEMQSLAEQWGWANNATGKDLDKLLRQMIDESDPKFPFGYIKLDEVASRARINSPPLNTVTHAIRKEGYAVTRSHIASNAIKTNCSMTECVRIIKELRGC